MASIRINQLSDGRLTYQVLWRDPDTRRQTSYTCDTQGEADNFKRLLEANGNSLTHTLALVDAIKKNVPTVAQVIELHIDTRSSANARSLSDYRRDATRHINPHLGHIPVTNLTEENVLRWLKMLAATDMADKTIANIHGLLSAALNTAVRAKDIDISKSPCADVTLPTRQVHQEMVFLTIEEWQVLDGEIGKRLDGWYQLMFRTLYLTGMRWGEVIALRVGDIAFNTKPPAIRVTRASKRDEHSRPYIGPTKTAKGRRTIGINDQLADALRAHVQGRPRAALVFTSRTGAAVLHSNVRSRVWVQAVAAAMDVATYGESALGERPRIHDLRHTHASQQIADGQDLLAVQRRLGHQSLRTTADRYGHLMPTQQLAAAESASRAMVW